MAFRIVQHDEYLGVETQTKDLMLVKKWEKVKPEIESQVIRHALKVMNEAQAAMEQ